MPDIRPREPLLLTPNERQAASLREAHDRNQIAAGEEVWETLAVCSWQTFLAHLWQERLLAHRGSQRLPSLLNPWQERFLWMRLLAGSPEGERLLNLPAASRVVAEAWSIVCSYELAEALQNPPTPWEEETQALLAWTGRLQDICQREHWLDSARLEPSLSEALRVGAIPAEALPSQLELVGFGQLSPSQQRLLDSCGALGVRVVAGEPQPHQAKDDWCRLVAEDEENELRLAARWIRAILESHPAHRPPRIGLVIPDLGASRPKVIRILDEVLQPGQLLPHTQVQHSLYNVSLGLPLAGWPVVADALSLLQLDGRWQPLPDYGVLFHSPFLAGAEGERNARALLEARLLRDGAYQITLSKVIRRARGLDSEGHARPSTCPLLGDKLDQVLAQLNAAPIEQPPSRWALEFKSTLDLYGWPGERTLDSEEFQTVVRWNELLAQLGSLDRIEPSLTRKQAVQALRRMAEETVYQPRVPTGPIEVLGYLEAAGLSFDHLWVAGLHDGAWPQAARPNPYLPRPMQRASGVPHSSAERELEFARRLTAQLLEGAAGGVVSCAAQDGEQTLRPSMLVAHLPEKAPADLKLSFLDSLHRGMFESGRLERIVDPGPPPVEEGRRSGGGTSIFKLQSACAFRAFASLRLYARPLDGVEAGLDAAQRGKMLHLVLEGFWRRVRSSRALHDWPEELREEALSEAIEAALVEGKRERPDVLSGAFLGLERERLTNLSHQWLALEAARPPFQVRDTERVVELEFGGVKLRAILDRVDRLPDGSLVLIDYKTGPVKYNDWLGERPAEPQLPLYLVASQEPIAALVYGRLRTGDMAFNGISERDEMLPGVDPSEQAGNLGMTWSDRQAGWRDVLTQLAVSFHRGEAAVAPLQRRKTCRNCRLETFCRVEELETRR